MNKKPIEEFGWQQDEKDKNRYSKPTNVIVGGYISNIIFDKNGITLSIQHKDVTSEEILAIYETAKMIEKEMEVENEEELIECVVKEDLNENISYSNQDISDRGLKFYNNVQDAINDDEE